MKVTIGRIELTIGWRYERSGKKKPTSRTFCYVGTYGEGGLNIIDEVNVRRHSSDAPCMEKARKASLTKLLKKAFPGRYDSPNNLELRTSVWKAYLSRSRKVTVREKRWIKNSKESYTKESERHPILS